MLNEFLFTKIEEEDGATCHTAEAALDVLRHYLWGAVKGECYADKPETIDALKGIIREAIGEIQLHTIDNVLKNWTDRVGYCMPSRGSQTEIWGNIQ